ncbi:MAG TPA: 4Fe-4S dicluster domain-containing protein [Thermoanaerobaculia bacterium]|nr:4Fe-4S dicluster domain-containing protein [Thermoanaerobaculia bacterium]
MGKAILYDATLCIGCLECESACARQNDLPYDDAIAKIKRTSETKLTYVAVRNTGEEKYLRQLCMHCEDPTCVSVCPVKAFTKTKQGPVVYDASKCMGCRYCMMACPFKVPKYEWSKAIPTVKKCIMCADRVAAGKPTACTEACPTGATITGERELLLTEARKRIAENPLQYVNHIYGEKEAGGTDVLMLSSVRFEEFGMPMNLPNESLPQITHNVLTHIPDVVTLGSALLGGVYWITHRRDIVAKVEAEQEQEPRS